MATTTRVPHPSMDERRAQGKEARDRTPPSSHSGWTPASDRPDPVGLLQEQNTTREPDLVPVRHGRMLVSPFTFYRGAAKIMAADLAATPTASLNVQLCGDAHLSNFGAFASPERRLLFETVTGYLTLRNGVPIGYVLSSTLFGSAEIAYNVFETWRGAEAARIFGRVLAMVRHLFGSDAFSIDPFQLGDANDEALDSGAWWFYRKVGFAPRAAAARRLMQREEERMRRRPGHRSSRAVLARLAAHHAYWFAGRPRIDVLSILPLERASLAASHHLAARFGAEREAGEIACADEIARRCGVRGWRGWSADERRAWRRWAPLLAIVPGLVRWPAAERRAVVTVVRAKGGRREADFARAFDRHARLRAAVVRLSGGR